MKTIKTPTNTTFIREIRVNYHNKKKLESLRSPEESAQLFRTLLPDNSREHFMCIYLDGNHSPIAYSVLTGIANACPVHPREIFQPALLTGACAVLLAHNHPSNCKQPSPEDRKATTKLCESGQIVGVNVLDHLVITDNDYTSIMHN